MTTLRRTLPLFWSLALLSCAAESPPSDARRATDSSEPRAANASLGVEPDTAGCNAIPKQQFPEPERLVHEWVRRDTLGLFVAPDDRLFELMECPGHLGGGDEVVVASRPTVTQAGTVADSVIFLVTYRRFGIVHADTSGARMIFESLPGIDSIRVAAVHTSYGWRFPFDVANPHLSPGVVLQTVKADWDTASRDSLTALGSLLRPE